MEAVSTVTLPTGTPALIARVDGSASTGLVIAPDIFGLRPLYEEMVTRFAREWGVPVVAVEPFPGRDLGTDLGPRSAVVPELDDEVHLRDLLEGADLLGTPRVVLMGFCMGGMYCFKAARHDRFARIASFYGMITLPAGWRSPSQGEPLEHLRSGHPDRVWAVIGGKDHYTPSDDVEALRATGVAVEFYPEAEHGFAHDSSRPLHRADDAADAFAKAKRWLLG
jgi:carboxymethylenebutenolidase